MHFIIRPIFQCRSVDFLDAVPATAQYHRGCGAASALSQLDFWLVAVRREAPVVQRFDGFNASTTWGGACRLALVVLHKCCARFRRACPGRSDNWRATSI
jgi:hypothetical protein